MSYDNDNNPKTRSEKHKKSSLKKANAYQGSKYTSKGIRIKMERMENSTIPKNQKK